VIPRKKKICKSCKREDYIFSQGKCVRCYKNSYEKVSKVSSKTKESIKASKIYYQVQIDTNKAKNKGKCICEECNKEIKEPIGRNVSHIISAGANKALYLEPLNSFILCVPCHNRWEFEDRQAMNIYPEAMERKEKLTLKYYQGFW
jgi:hypothetical protein